MKRSRRDFLGVLGGAAAGSWVARSALGYTSASSPAAQTPGGRKIGYGIVGLGRISLGEFMPGVRISERSKLVALVSGHRDKAERVADQYGITRQAIYSYENYEEIAHNPAIDALYIALPNSMHAEYTIRGAKAGKHVLCEKPMANTVAECEQMIAACREAGRKLMIAYRCRLEPTNRRAIELLRQGYVGTVQTLHSAFGFNIKPGEWRLSKKMAGGGPMMDVGIYSLQACRSLTGEEPVEVSAISSVIDHDGRFNEVEETLVWTMRFPSGVITTCQTSYGAGLGDYINVSGSKGWVKVDPAFVYDGLHLSAQGNGAAIDQATDDPSPRQFAREADHFSDCILGNHEPLTGGEEGLRDMRLIASIYQSCRDGRAVKTG
jgi:predicted dehydrogenase